MFGVSLQRFAFSSFAVVTAFAASASDGSERSDPAVQYIAISFDGAREIEQWERSRDLARETGARFTYFLSCVYLLSRDDAGLYEPPGMPAGKSNVGFAESRESVAERLHQIWDARGEGHEIANHGCGHFDGGSWTEADWLAEFDQFNRIMRDAWTLNDVPSEPDEWRLFTETEITGFRAPYLAVGPSLAPALANAGFTYDASSVSRDPVTPAVEGGLSFFSLPLIPEGPKARRVLAMDYNLYVRHSAALERPSDSELFEERTLAAFRAAFERQYNGDRIPLQFGFHFRLMNGGAYWRALETFAREVCSKPDVRCVTYAELTGVYAAPERTSDIQPPATD
ncbi:MAG: polysaccharide deacetylase [Rhizobiaceae bacterium]|nr:polysaccharide deacetylase [Rhizobiaceae bacterium]